MKTLKFTEKVEVKKTFDIEIPCYLKKKYTDSMVMITEEKTVSIYDKMLVFEVEPSKYLMEEIQLGQYTVMTEEEFKTAYLQAKKQFML